MSTKPISSSAASEITPNRNTTIVVPSTLPTAAVARRIPAVW
nr:hypothetical protein [Microbacterium sp. SYP-A9085]